MAARSVGSRMSPTVVAVFMYTEGISTASSTQVSVRRTGAEPASASAAACRVAPPP